MNRQRFPRAAAAVVPRGGLGKIRRSQIISTYGVGSIVPVGDESFMIAGIDHWRVEPDDDVHEARLERQLGISRLCLPPARRPEGDIPVVRFPMWASCPVCRRLDEHGFFCGKNENKCNRCDVKLVPSRFVAACKNGHIQDFPYFAWVHSRQKRTEGMRHDMSIKTAGVSASLRDVVVECSCGVPERTMDGAFSEWALRDITKCRGSRPWLQDAEQGCAETLRTLQRGASNVYFAISRSALSIPPWSEEAYKLLSTVWRSIKHTPRDVLPEVFAGMLQESWKGVKVSAEEFSRLAVDRLERESVGIGQMPADDDSLRSEEYKALCREKLDGGERQDFVAVPAVNQDHLVDEWFDQVMLVKRLREVRALEGFVRLQEYTPGEPEGRKARLFKSDPGWLPAIEVTGEGVFLRISSDRLESWESRGDVQERARRVDRNLVSRFATLGLRPNQRITPRMLLLHSLSHALLNQWSLECGYPAAALRERLYVSDSMSGILIYTASTDSAGSLGGVIAQAETGRLAATVAGAMATAGWCSSDPLCIETEAAGVDSLNLAACHACLLLPEVSCEHGNVFLDRAMLVGTAENPEMGLFSSLGG